MSNPYEPIKESVYVDLGSSDPTIRVTEPISISLLYINGQLLSEGREGEYTSADNVITFAPEFVSQFAQSGPMQFQVVYWPSVP